MTRAFLFPGQGSQAVGMGQTVAQAFDPAREVFEEVDEVLKQKLSKLMWEGPDSELVLTANAQPAIMAASLAVIRVLEREAGLDLARHARLLRLRGQAMQDAAPPGAGAMSALIGIEVSDAEAAVVEAAAQGGVCVVANDNAPGQVVISRSDFGQMQLQSLEADRNGGRRLPARAGTSRSRCAYFPRRQT